MMRDPDERIVHCLEAIITELHEMNKQLKIANQQSVIANIPTRLASDVIKQRAVEIVKELDLA